MKIGLIGCGNIGQALARHWVKAGYSVILSSRHPEKLQKFSQELGASATVGTPEQAAREGDVILLTLPLGEIPKLSPEVVNALRDKIVLDTCNPYPERDGAAADEVLRRGQGTGVWTASQLPGARIVRAFNSVYFKLLESEAHRSGDPIGIPLASDDSEALATAKRLVKDAGFGPVNVGNLRRAALFDPGTPPYASGATDRELKEKFRLQEPVPENSSAA